MKDLIERYDAALNAGDSEAMLALAPSFGEMT